jgi:Flp pilus assembly pilin Flp
VLRIEIASSSFHRAAERSISAMTALMRRLWIEDNGRNLAEYAVMFAVIVVMVVSNIRLLGSN